MQDFHRRLAALREVHARQLRELVTSGRRQLGDYVERGLARDATSPAVAMWSGVCDSVDAEAGVFKDMAQSSLEVRRPQMTDRGADSLTAACAL